MGRNTAWGTNAYREARREGGSKEEAKVAQSEASDRYSKSTQERQFGNSDEMNNDGSDFGSDINRNGTHWHDSSDI